MADDLFDSLRLSLMQEVLPVGLAVVERARTGGPGKVVEAFQQSADPLLDLRQEGEEAARSVRQRLDDLSPGLGNPVMSVHVDVEDVDPQPDRDSSPVDLVNDVDFDQPQDQLFAVLERIEVRLDALQKHLRDDSSVDQSIDSAVSMAHGPLDQDMDKQNADQHKQESEPDSAANR